MGAGQSGLAVDYGVTVMAVRATEGVFKVETTHGTKTALSVVGRLGRTQCRTFRRRPRGWPRDPSSCTAPGTGIQVPCPTAADPPSRGIPPHG